MSQRPPLSNEDLLALSAYLDDDLPPAERMALQARLETEETLRSELESLRQTVALLKSLPIMRAPRDFTLDPAVFGAQVASNSANTDHQNVTPLARRGRLSILQFSVVLSAAAALVLVFAVVFALGENNEASSPVDDSQQAGINNDATPTAELSIQMNMTAVAQDPPTNTPLATATTTADEPTFMPTVRSTQEPIATPHRDTDNTEIDMPSSEAGDSTTSTSETSVTLAPTATMIETALPNTGGGASAAGPGDTVGIGLTATMGIQFMPPTPTPFSTSQAIGSVTGDDASNAEPDTAPETLSDAAPVDDDAAEESDFADTDAITSQASEVAEESVEVFAEEGAIDTDTRDRSGDDTAPHTETDSAVGEETESMPEAAAAPPSEEMDLEALRDEDTARNAEDIGLQEVSISIIDAAKALVKQLIAGLSFYGR